MVDDKLRYDRMLERALRGVVREALAYTAEHGLPGEHHFYISFLTAFAGVAIPEYLQRKYPDEMTIVIQYQFYGLDVDDERFSVTLSFNHSQERLTVPLAAITTFADPSVNFALQFQAVQAETAGATTPAAPGSAGLGPAELGSAEDGAAEEATGKIVTLDSFRKK